MELKCGSRAARGRARVTVRLAGRRRPDALASCDPTFYGDEDDLVPPSDLFDRTEAEGAIAAVERLLGLYRGLFEIA